MYDYKFTVSRNKFMAKAPPPLDGFVDINAKAPADVSNVRRGSIAH